MSLPLETPSVVAHNRSMAQANTHENLQRNHGFKAATPTQFGFNMGILCGLISGGLLFMGQKLWAPFLIVGLMFLLASIFAPFVLSPINKGWTALGLILARITNPLIILLFFAIIIFPMALIFRTFSKQTFSKKNNNQESSWEPRSASLDFERQF